MDRRFPPLPAQGDPNADATYAGVGYALTRWEHAETELCWLTAAFMGLPRGDYRAVEAHSHSATFQGRSATLEAKAEAYWTKNCDQAKEGEFKRLLVLSRALSERRNEIAHGIVTVLREWRPKAPDGSLLPRPALRVEFCLVPGLYDRRKVEPGDSPKYLYVSTDMRGFGDQFQKLADDVRNFTTGL